MSSASGGYAPRRSPQTPIGALALDPAEGLPSPDSQVCPPPKQIPGYAPECTQRSRYSAWNCAINWLLTIDIQKLFYWLVTVQRGERNWSVCVSSFLTVHQRMKGHFVPWWCAESCALGLSRKSRGNVIATLPRYRYSTTKKAVISQISGVAMDCAACAKHRGPRAWGAHLSWSAELIFLNNVNNLYRYCVRTKSLAHLQSALSLFHTL